MSTALRYPLCALAGTLAALGMLWAMQLLVTSPAQKLPVSESMRLVEFVRLKREENLQTRERRPPPPPEKAVPPPRPRINLQADSQPLAPKLDMAMNLDLPMNFGDGPWLGPMASAEANSGFVPLSQQPPQYPYKAARRGIEGWVKVRFEVTEKGSVNKVEVIESEPPGMFDNAAVRAVNRWRFKPRIIDGKAVPGEATQVVEFKLNRRER